MWLHAERDGSGPRLVLVHGFTQTGRCWGPVAEDLATDHEVVRVDAPGHGRSSDVLAGWCLGTAWAMACWFVARRLQREGQVEQKIG